LPIYYEARALAFTCSNSAWLMVPLSNSSLALAICPAVSLDPPLAHLLTLRDEVDEDPEEWQHDHEQRPTGLAPTADVMPTEEISEHSEQKPEKEDPGEEDEHRPHHLAERVGKNHLCPFRDCRGIDERTLA
jgi:hypothetical protein